MIYREEKSVTSGTKQSYVNQLDALLQSKQEEAAKLRADYARNIFREPERYRSDLRQMLGWPLVGQKDTAPPAVTVEELCHEEGYTIFDGVHEFYKDDAPILRLVDHLKNAQ